MEKNVMNGKSFRNARRGKKAQGHNPADPVQAAQRALMTVGAIVGAVLLIGAMAGPLCAQSYPNRPIRFVLNMAPGGAVDILGRIVGAKLAERLGQPVIPDNRGGGGGNIGIEFVAKARPDGYTLLLGSTGLAFSPALYKKLNYDPIKDLVPVSLVADTHAVLCVRPSLPVKDLKEFVEYAKAHPGKLNFGSSGIGATPHLAAELFKGLTKIDIVHVPYKGGGPALVAMMGGEVDMSVLGAATALPYIQSGQIRPLAVFSSKRAQALPNIPTAKEAGVDNCVVPGWYGILATAGTPRDIVDRLNSEWIKIEKMPDTIEKLQTAGVEPTSSTPEQFAEFLKAEIVRWGKVIREANVTIN
jgi:tripartite-type tricarboxylate transporter receptor subunit TctC